MAPVEKLTISGFRGILTPLELSFKKGNSVRPMVIYGRNGTGKSSITDAWEWLHTGKIQRLAREGARERSYPHTDAEDGDTYVEVHLSDPETDTIRLTFNRERITIPEVRGEIEQFRDLVPHPCHIRFGDLTEFVYLEKAKKYDALSGLMGFTPQVEFQKALNRTLRKLGEELEAREREVARIGDELKEILELEVLRDSVVLERINQVLDRHELESVDSVDAAQASSETLRERVEKDPRSRELADLSELEKACEEAIVPEGVWDKVSSFAEAARKFKRQEGETVDLLLIDLYTKGQEVLDDRRSRDESTDRCPLCGQNVEEAELVAHIAEELERLRALKEARDELEGQREQVSQCLDDLDGLSTDLKKGCSNLELSGKRWSFEQLGALAEVIESESAAVSAILEKAPEELTDESVSSLSERQEVGEEASARFETARQALIERITERQEKLRKDEARSRLVNDHELLRDGLDRWRKWRGARQESQGLKPVHGDFEALVEAFIADSMENVQERFETISDGVDRFFGILEQHTDRISSPRLKLLTEQDRAVMLEVEFRGEDIRPAYKYLSESQLNSFGLAVFLASAKHFNPEFRFLLLDDVINSFDGYKRPLVIQLLKEEFPDHQFLLLTHDPIWTDRLFEAFPRWVRRRFTRFTSTGPVLNKGYSELEKVQRRIDDDEPTDAGRSMGPFLERQLHDLCDAFEVMVKFNRRHEYTLDQLLTRFRVRVKNKLGGEHPLTVAVRELEEDSGFRNLCAHWKDPAIALSREEMQRVVDRWKAVRAQVRCSKESCRRVLRYDGSGKFVCHCGSTVLEKNTGKPV